MSDGEGLFGGRRRWLRRSLSDFRSAHAGWLDRTLTASVAVLLHKRLVRVAQDGLKVRASAGAASFRRRESLEKCRRTPTTTGGQAVR